MLFKLVVTRVSTPTGTPPPSRYLALDAPNTDASQTEQMPKPSSPRGRKAPQPPPSPKPNTPTKE